MNKTMKKTLFFLNICLLLVVCMFSSCTTDNNNIISLDELLIGKWQSGTTLFINYASDHTGTIWGADVGATEAEPLKFQWALEYESLILTYERGFEEFYIVYVTNNTTLRYYVLSTPNIVVDNLKWLTFIKLE